MKGIEPQPMKDSVSMKTGKTFDETVGMNSNPEIMDVELVHFRPNPVTGEKEAIDVRRYKNVVTNTGKAQMAGIFLTDVAGTAFDYIGIGTGTTAAVATDTALETEISTGGGARAAGTGTRVTTTVTNDTSQLQVTFNFTASFAVTESGVFNAAAAGVMATRRVFSAINVANGDSLQVTWKVAFA